MTSKEIVIKLAKTGPVNRFCSCAGCQRNREDVNELQKEAKKLVKRSKK